MARVTVSFSLDDQTDQDIITWLDGLGRGDRSSAIRDALRAAIGAQRVTLDDVLAVVARVERKLDRGATVTGASTTEAEADVDQAALDALDGLGL